MTIKNTYFGEGSICREWLDYKFGPHCHIRLFSIVDQVWKLADTNLGVKSFLTDCDHLMVYLDGADLYNYDKVTVAKFTEIYAAPPKYIKEPANINENPPFSPAWHEAQSAAGKALREFLADLKRLATKAQTRRLFICREQPQFAVGVNSDQITLRVGKFFIIFRSHIFLPALAKSRSKFLFFSHLRKRLVARSFHQK